jgi:hypothetical protein
MFEWFGKNVGNLWGLMAGLFILMLVTLFFEKAWLKSYRIENSRKQYVTAYNQCLAQLDRVTKKGK